jgi:hypothetical protein
MESQRRLVKLYEAWDAAEPGRGFDRKAVEWQEGLEEPGAASRPVH